LKKNYKTYDFFIKEKENKEKNQKEIYLKTNDEKTFDSFKFKTSIISYEIYKKIEKGKIEFFALDDLDDISIKVRYRINGDYFTYLKDGKRKKLKNYFIDEKVDKNIRDKIPLLFINDKLCLIVGKRRSEDFKVSEKSRKILMVSVEEL
uniref:tRNA lysidine(34) synthetase TilS n=1 Tax=Anaerococcus hydrogenalis TaxID=33029 RepID=UPI0023F3E8D1